MLCPCHSDKEYSECCKRFHEGEPAPTPEQLMRSRYSAYALNLSDYILDTQEEKVPKEQIEQFSKSTDFRNLEILRVEPTCVTFHATLFQDGQDVSFTERSLFEKRNERWIYVKRLP